MVVNPTIASTNQRLFHITFKYCLSSIFLLSGIGDRGSGIGTRCRPPIPDPRSPIPNEIGYTAFEHFRIELLSVVADLGRVICPAVEAAHHLGQRLGGLF